MSTHVSGHASGPNLKKFVDQVNTKNVIPLHTENAKAFQIATFTLRMMAIQSMKTSFMALFDWPHHAATLSTNIL
ncbi:MAG: MBL fold metallo-hydrolase RNA specificity domain-containing protein [Candidatus Bathyarchaeia archaeon]